MAAVVATALRPISNRISVLLGEMPWMSELEQERFERKLLEDRARRASFLRGLRSRVPLNLVLFAVVYGINWFRNPRVALMVTVLVAAIVLSVLVVLSVSRTLVAARVLPARNLAAILTLVGIVGAAGALMILFSVGMAKDLVQGVQDVGQFARRVVEESGGDDLVVQQLEKAEEKLKEAVAQNRERIRNVASSVKEYTAMDLDEIVEILSSDEQVGDNNAMDYAALKVAIIKQIPRSREDLQRHLNHVSSKVQDIEIDWEPYKAQGIEFVKKLVAGAGDIVAKIGEYFQHAGVIVTFLGLLPIFLGRERSTVSILTDIIPMPSRYYNDLIELDVRTAITSLFWGVMRTFAIQLGFVYLLFSAFRLNFEFLAAALSAIGSSVPFLPGGIVWTALLGAPQLAAREKWAELVALLGLHLFLDSGVDAFYDLARKEMTIGASILDRKLVSLVVVLAVPMFGKRALLFGPLIVILCLVVYEIYVFLNAEKYANSSSLDELDDEIKQG